MSWWTSLRDTIETGAVLVGNYIAPGSSLITSNLTSEGSQDQLNSTVGKLAQLGTGGAGAFEGNLANYGKAFDAVTGSAGASGGSWITPPGGGAAEFVPAVAGAGMSSYMLPAAIFGSSLIGANAAKGAATTQADAQTQANQLAYSQYIQQRADLQPFVNAGAGAQNKLLGYLGLPGGTPGTDFGKYTKDFTSADFLANQDPGYSFRFTEGLKALDRSAAAKGGLISGGALKAATRFGQDLGSQEYQNAYNRYQNNRTNQLAPLFSLTGSGQSSAAGQAAASGNYASAAGAGLTNVGAANAAGTVGAANALTNGLGSYLAYSGQQDMINAYNARSAAGRSSYQT
jgi:hypothetical protein